MKNPLKMAEYVISMTAELHNLGLRMIQDFLEAMDQMLQESPIRLKQWIVESHTTKHFRKRIVDLLRKCHSID